MWIDGKDNQGNTIIDACFSLLCLNTMEIYRMGDLTAKTDEFVEVDYQFEIKD